MRIPKSAVRVEAGAPGVSALRVWESEQFELSRALSPRADLSLAGPDHFLRWPSPYDSRRFIACEVEDVVWTREAKAVGFPDRGMADDFYVGGVDHLLLDLVRNDLRESEDAWTLPDDEVERVDGVLAVPICHYGVSAFGHFVYDALLQAYLFRDRLADGSAQLVYWGLDPWMRPVLDAVGVPAQAHRMLSGPAVRFARAGLSSALGAQGVYFPNSLSVEFVDWLKQTLAPRGIGRVRRALRTALAPSASKRLYLRRSPAYPRRLLNAEAMEALLVRRGFEVVEPQTLPFARQAEMMRAAGVVVSPWGSSLTLAPLLGPPRRVIEILPASVTDAWFYRQAAVHGLDYLPVLAADAPDGDAVVDLDRLDEALSGAVAR